MASPTDIVDVNAAHDEFNLEQELRLAKSCGALRDAKDDLFLVQPVVVTVENVLSVSTNVNKHETTPHTVKMCFVDAYLKLREATTHMKLLAGYVTYMKRKMVVWKKMGGDMANNAGGFEFDVVSFEPFHYHA